MLPSKHRLKKKKDFKRVYEQGKGFKEDFLFLKVAANELGVTRIGIIVGKKVSNKAVERNLVKRRLREVARERLGKMESGLDIVIISLGEAIKKKSFQEIGRVFEGLLIRSRIIKK